MKALTYQGKKKVKVKEVADPTLEKKMTSLFGLPLRRFVARICTFITGNTRYA